MEKDWNVKWQVFNRKFLIKHRVLRLIILWPSLVLNVLAEHYLICHKGTFMKDISRLMGNVLGYLIVTIVLCLILKVAVFFFGTALTAILLVGSVILALRKK